MGLNGESLLLLYICHTHKVHKLEGITYTIPEGRKTVTFQNLGNKIAWYGGSTVAPAGNIGISATNLKTVPIPVPSVDEQGLIVEKLERVQRVVGHLSRLGHTSTSQIDALLPSILDKAFRGEL